VIVDLDKRIPVKIDQRLSVGVKLDTKVDVDDRIALEGSIPVSAELPIDTEISTTVFGLGSIKIPIRARIPLNITIPLKTTMHVRATGIPIHLDEKTEIELPVLEVPIKHGITSQSGIFATVVDNIATLVSQLRSHNARIRINLTYLLKSDN
jgi:hypothetical protein